MSPADRLVIRPGRPDDLDVLVELGRRYCEADGHDFHEARTRQAFARLMAEPRWGTVLVAELDSAAVGYAVVTSGYSIESGGPDALLDEIYLDVRGEGLGSTLLQRVLDEARRWGASRLFLETEAANERARAFYLRHRFHQEDSIWLSIDLDVDDRPDPAGS
ncbi:MAG: GNAT family N-acetyltransferase [Acidimicrobiales bacterium]